MHILATRLDYKENALQIVTMCNHRKVLVSYYLFIIYPKLFFLIKFWNHKNQNDNFFLYFLFMETGFKSEHWLLCLS